MNVINMVKSECIAIALEYGHEYVTYEHLILHLLDHEEASETMSMFDVPLEELQSKTLDNLAKYQPTIDSEENIKMGLDINRVFEASVIMRGSSMNVTIADIVYHTIDIARQDMEDGSSHSLIAGLVDLEQLENSMHKYITGGNAGIVMADPSENNETQEDTFTNGGKTNEKMFTTLDANNEKLISHQGAVKLALHTLGQSSNALAVLVGENFSGKSSVIQEIVNRANDESSDIPISGLKFISLNINRAMMSVSHDAGAHINTSVKAAEREGAILVIDDIHNLASSMYEQNIGTLLQRAARSGIKIICTTNSSGFAKIFEKNDVSDSVSKISLKEPSEDEAAILLEREIDNNKIIYALEFEENLSQRCVEMTKDHFRGSILMNGYKILNRAVSIALNSGSKSVDTKLLEDAVCEIKGITKDGLDLTANQIVMGLGDRMKENVFGQNEAIDKIAKAVRTSMMGFKENPNRPNACMMMLGSTGTGKTETAIQMSKELGKELIRLDMSEYQESHTVSKLLGAPAGYAGHNDGDGFLYEKINKNPDAIVLFDEIEKAHPNIFRLLLGAMDHGVLTTSTNKQISFKDTFLLFTSNIGVVSSESGGFGLFASDESSVEIDKGAYEKTFASEFRNRIDVLIEFQTLNEDIALMIVDKVTNRVALSLKKSQNINLNVDESASRLLVSKSYSLTDGARAISRGFQSHISSLVIDKLTDLDADGHKKTPPSNVDVSAHDGEFFVTLR
ncbi:ATP-dependent Clp protease ATP-binding subunit ClpA [Vibrio chagasii]|nr:ATP-dependent Clp protease ATP-binding subunit ClpA [Vibrio chagasii]